MKLNDKSCREIAIRLLKMYQRYSIGIAKIEEAGLELPESIKEDFYDIVLDLLGVPEDDHSDSINVQGFSGYETINYCREWLWDVDMNADTEEIVKWIEGQVKLYHNEHGKLSDYSGLLEPVPKNENLIHLEKRMQQTSIDNISVDEMELTVRTDNCLQSRGIRTIGQLVKKKASELYKIKNFGRKSGTEIEVRLEELGLTLEQ